MLMALVITFWLCAGLVVYTYCAYPLLVWVCSRNRMSVPPALESQKPRLARINYSNKPYGGFNDAAQLILFDGRPRIAARNGAIWIFRQWGAES